MHLNRIVAHDHATRMSQLFMATQPPREGLLHCQLGRVLDGFHHCTSTMIAIYFTKVTKSPRPGIWHAVLQSAALEFGMQSFTESPAGSPGWAVSSRSLLNKGVGGSLVQCTVAIEQ